MSMRLGIVVDTHPDDNAVDLYMTDNGERIIGVKVMSGSASARTGSIDLPEVTAKSNKWDMTAADEQEVRAVVGYIGRTPVVQGFILPPKNQITITDKRTKYSRHQSDVQFSIDGDGNTQIAHPSGAFIRIGETPELAQVATAQSSNVDRNTDRKVFVRVGLADNAVIITLTPDGDMQVKLQRDMSVEAGGSINLRAAQNFSLEVDGNVSLSAKGSASIKTNGATSIDAGGSVSIKSSGATSIDASSVTVKSSGSASIDCSTASIKASGGLQIDAPMVKCSGLVSAKDYLKG